MQSFNFHKTTIKVIHLYNLLWLKNTRTLDSWFQASLGWFLEGRTWVLIKNKILTFWGCSSVWLERFPVTEEAEGSSPFTPAISKTHNSCIGLTTQTDGEVIYIFVNERNIMQSIINLFSSLGKIFTSTNFGTVDPNLVRFYRVEYGSRWKEKLNEHLYSKDN